MKNYLFIITALIISLSFSSCSKEDDLIIEESLTQLCTKRTVDFYGFNGVDRKIYDYNYDGTRLLDWKFTRIKDNDTITETYRNIYTGDNITSMIVSESNGITIYDFEYDNLGRVIKQFQNSSLEFTYIYIGYVVKKYNSDTVLIEEQTYDYNNNLILNKYLDSTWTRIYENTHDNKNMPFMNVDSWYPLSPFRYLGPNNTTSITVLFSTSTGIPTGSTINMNISYDANDFPTYIATSYSDGTSKSEILEYNL